MTYTYDRRSVDEWMSLASFNLNQVSISDILIFNKIRYGSKESYIWVKLIRKNNCHACVLTMGMLGVGELWRLIFPTYEILQSIFNRGREGLAINNVSFCGFSPPIFHLLKCPFSYPLPNFEYLIMSCYYHPPQHSQFRRSGWALETGTSYGYTLRTSEVHYSLLENVL